MKNRPFKHHSERKINQEYCWSMQKLICSALFLTLLFPTPAYSATLKFKNQRAGQFCKNTDINKTVQLPNKTILICLKDGLRARWVNK